MIYFKCKGGGSTHYETFDIVALGMRYVFLILIGYILVLTVKQSVKESRSVREVKKGIAGGTGWVLTITEPELYKGERFELFRENIIGSSVSCDISIKAKNVAPVHAAIYEKKGRTYITDYGSKTGSLVNGVRIGRRGSEIEPGDDIRLGLLRFSITLDREDESFV